MSDHLNISDFLSPLNIHRISLDEGYKDGQFGSSVITYSDEFPDLDDIQVVLVGCGEQRGSGVAHISSNAPDVIRHQLYSLFYWHSDIKIADIGNIRTGSLYTDSYAALKTVVQELINDGKTVIILGGSHDLTLSQYQAYASRKKPIEATCIDALIDLNIDSSFHHENFLM